MGIINFIIKDGLPGCSRDADQCYQHHVLEVYVVAVRFVLPEWSLKTNRRR